MRNRLPLLALVSVFGVSFAFGDNFRGPYTEKKGVLEFTGTMIVRPVQLESWIAKGHSTDAAQRLHKRAIDRLQATKLRYYPEVDEVVVRVPNGMTETALANRLMQTGDYEYATPNWRCYPTGPKVTPNDPLFVNQWHHTVMHSTEAWFIGRGKNNVTVAVIDTGVYT